jgi:hypothetical protein
MESENLIYAQVIYNYETSYSDELQVKAGEIIQVVSYLKYLFIISSFNLIRLQRFCIKLMKTMCTPSV